MVTADPFARRRFPRRRATRRWTSAHFCGWTAIRVSVLRRPIDLRVDSSSRTASTWPSWQRRRTAASAACPPDRPPRLCPAAVEPRASTEQATSSGVRPFSIARVDLRAVEQQPRRVVRGRGDVQRPQSFAARSTSAPLSSSSRAASTWPFSRRRTAASSRLLAWRPPRLCPAAAAASAPGDE